MTIVELFDVRPINNVVGLLSFNPDKIIYVGGDSKKHFNGRTLPVLNAFLEHKKLDVPVIEYVNVKRNSLKDIVDNLEKIYKDNADCRFHVEVTGGEDLVLVALGVMFARHPEIQMYRINSKLTNLFSFSWDNEDGEKLDVTVSNSVEDNLVLHGASIVSSNGDETVTGGFDYSAEFLSDLNKMWTILCEGTGKGQSAPNSWNRVCYTLSKLTSEYAAKTGVNAFEINENGLSTLFYTSSSEDMFNSYIDAFSKNGWLVWTKKDNGAVVVFKNDQIRVCLTKSGLVLELKTYLICSKLFKERGGDCLTGVTIDWDGEDDVSAKDKFLSDPEDSDSTIDTINEVDVVANLGLVPYFISCKNGGMNSDELYKLYSIGQRFGSGYAKLLIVTTDISFALGDSENLFRQRALDMGIDILSNVHTVSDDELTDALRKILDLQKIKKPSILN